MVFFAEINKTHTAPVGRYFRIGGGIQVNQYVAIVFGEEGDGLNAAYIKTKENPAK